MSKRFFYTALFVLIADSILAQVNISTRVERQLFIGIDNPITIASTKIPLRNLSVKIQDVFLQGKNGNYIARFSAPAKEVIIKVLYNNKLVTAKKMDVVRVSDPEVFVAGDTLVTGGTISKKLLLTFDSLVVKTNVPYLPMTVVRFKFTRIVNGVITDSINNTGYLFSAAIKKVLADSSAGDVIIFEEAFATGPDDNGSFQQSIKLTVGN